MILGAASRVALETRFGARIRSRPDGTVEVIPGGVVGTMRVDDQVFVVKPKMPIDRVLFMVAFAADPYTWEDQTAALGKVDELIEGVSALFVRATRQLLAQGLLRSYRGVERDAPYVKGRVDWGRQSRRFAPVPIALRHQVHDDDIVENQLIHAVVERLRRARFGTSPTPDLVRLWRRVSHLTPLREPLATLDTVVWTRRNAHYRPILELGRIILANLMVDVATGDVPVDGFALEMSDVFERFVRRALREATKATADDFPDDWTGRGLALAKSGAIRLIPDLGVRVQGSWRFVGDVKYKRDDGPGRHADLYQVMAYAVATGLPEATLIYAHGPAEPRAHLVRHLGIELRVVHLDLTKPPKEVLWTINDLSSKVGRLGGQRGLGLSGSTDELRIADATSQ